MSELFRRIAFGALIAGGLAFAPAVYAAQSASGAERTPSLMGMHGGIMDRNDGEGSRAENDGRSGMTGMMMGGMGQRTDGCSSMMESDNRPPNSQFRKPSEQSQKD